jgi:hypothetical protein
MAKSSANRIQEGQRVGWLYRPENQPHVPTTRRKLDWRPEAEVLRIGQQAVLVQVIRRDGSTVERWVKRSRLVPR